MCQNLPARVRVGPVRTDVRALATLAAGGSIRFALSLFRGGLVEDHHDMMLAERICLILLLTSVSQNLPAGESVPGGLKKNIAVSTSSLFRYLSLYLW